MNSKLVTVFLVAFVALPLLAEPIRTPLGAPFDDLINLAEQVLQSAGKAINGAIDEATIVLRELIKAVDGLKNNAIRLFDNLLEAEVKEVNKLIDQLKNRTDATSKKTLQCIEDNQKQFTIVEEQANNYVDTCINKATDQVLNDTFAILADVQKLNNEIVKQEQGLEKCKGLVLPVDCITKVVNDVVALASSLPARVKNDVAKVRSDFDKLGTTVQACVNYGYNLAKDGDDKVYKNITACIDKKTPILY